jgi:hypothetical protein
VNNSQNFLIGTIDQGVTKDLKPWATPSDSFEKLTNMYQWRGRIVRKNSYSYLSQLTFVVASQNLGASAANFSINLFTALSLTGVSVLPESISITVNGGANYTLAEDPDNPGSIILISGANVPAFLNGSINYITGDLVLNFAGAPGGNVVISFSYVYSLPVMGLRTRELFELNEQDTIAFDTRFAYRFSNTSDQFVPLPSIMPTEWSGTDSQFFFTTNYAGAFWATNSKLGLHGWAVTDFAGSAGVGTSATVNVTSAGNAVAIGDYVHFINLDPSLVNNSGILAIVTAAGNPFTVRAVAFPSVPANLDTTFSWTNGITATGMVLDSMKSITNNDGIRYYGALTNGTGWANYNPPIDTSNALAGALLIFPYRGYLVFLNTTEGNDAGTFNFGNRARWTQIGTPYYSEPVPSTPNPQSFQIDAVRDDLFGKGGANDAPTQEVIIGAAFVRDILVVFFERSCWRLRFVNNAQNPFVWERINVELGSSATFSTIAFDKGAMAIGERGIVIADSNDVIRIDDKIPDEIFRIRIENEGMQRVNGIRTFRTRLNYWTMPSVVNPDGIFPDNVLVYNYDTKTWAVFDDCFTCFGYFYAFDDATWADLTEAWSSYGNITWGGGNIQAGYENIIAGNQQGFVLNLDSGLDTKDDGGVGQNGPSLMITAITAADPAVFTSPNNNLPDGSWINLSGIAGITDVTGVTLNGRAYKVVNPGGPSAQPNTFSLQEFTPYAAGQASGGTFNFTLASPYLPIFPGSVYITVGSITFTDPGLNGVLKDLSGLSTGIIDYQTGVLTLFFVPVLGAPTDVFIRVVSQNPDQGMSNVATTGTYTGGGYIAKISNVDIQTKYFNFLPQDKRSRLSRIDFYVNTTTNGEFTANVLADSSNQIINSPLKDNLRSNIVRTSLNPYQYGVGEQTIYRLYANAVAQTIQVQMTLSDQQMAVNSISSANIEIQAMNFSLRPGGRLP